MGTRASETIGRRIRAAREDAGLTQQDLAEAMPFGRTDLSKIETGTRKVSAVELASIADALDVRIEWFLDDAPSAVVSRRNTREPGAPSPAIDKLTERVAREVEFVASHDPHLARLASPEPLASPTNRATVESAAASARRLLEVDPDEPLLDLSRRVAKIGLLAFSFDLGIDAAEGSSILLTNGGVAVVNGHLHVGRRRLTLAHELGHYLFADEFSVDWQIAGPTQSGRESKIDAFARAVLLPRVALEDTWKRHTMDERSIREAAVMTASAFRVDMATLASRLLELRLVPRGVSQQIREVRTTKADIVDLDLLVHHELEPPELAQPYVAAVLRLYRQEVVSPARALDLLCDTWDEADLPPLPMLPEDAIWSFVS